KAAAKEQAKKARSGQELAEGRDKLIANDVITDPSTQQGGQPAKHQATMPSAEVDPSEAGMASGLADNFTLFSDPIDAVGGAIGGTGDYIGIRADYEDATPGHANEKSDEDKDTGAEYTSTVLGTASAGIGAATSGVSAVAGGLATFDNIQQFR